jgi:hypothetical protein
MYDAADRSGCYLVEWYRGEEWQNESFARCFAKLRVGAEFLGEDGAPATVLMTLSIPSDDAVFCVFEATSPQSVASICERAGLPPQRVTAAFTVA